MAAWDRRSARALRKGQDLAVREQVRDAVAPFSPYWRERLAALGRPAGTLTDVASLATLPAVGERDVCPDGDPAHAAGLVLQADEAGFAQHAPGPQLRRAMLRRLGRSSSYRRLVEADTRPTSYVWAGLGLRFPVASTRSDLDLVARAGARLWQVLGLTAADVLVSAGPAEQSIDHQALSLAALAAGSPALFPGSVAGAVATMALVPASVLAVPSALARDLLEALADSGTDCAGVTALLLVGAPTHDERAAARAALDAAGASAAAVLGVHAPSGARVLWGECHESVAAGTSAGYHSYPDLEVVQVVDPETGEPPAEGQTGRALELVLSQLGFRGSALLRWRTGDLVPGPASDESCPGCGRRVPRIPADLLRGALVVGVGDGAEQRFPVDLRAVAGVLTGRAHLADWQVEVAGGRLRVTLASEPDRDAPAADTAVRELAAATGLPADRVLVQTTTGALPGLHKPLTERMAVRT
ncbi:MAG: hypothetical protein M3Z02_03785 [Actinomycetota bacterium]|nr:hypothetical protein [Actinomycetota bacterium]